MLSLGFQTQGHMMVGVDETTELWQPPISSRLKIKLEYLAKHPRTFAAFIIPTYSQPKTTRLIQLLISYRAV